MLDAAGSCAQLKNRSTQRKIHYHRLWGGSTSLEEHTTPTAQYQGGDLFPYLQLLWRQRRFIVTAVGAIALAAAVVSTWLLRPVYEANSLVGVGGDGLGPPEVYQQLLLSGRALQRAARVAGVPVDVFKRAVEVELVRDTGLLRLTARGGSPAEAEARGRAWYTALRTETQEPLHEKLRQATTMTATHLEGMKQTFFEINRTPDEEKARQNTVLQKGDALAVMVQAGGEVRRLQAASEQVQGGRAHDVQVLSEFAAGPRPVAPRRATTVVVAGLVALVAAMSLVLTREWWRAAQREAGSRR